MVASVVAGVETPVESDRSRRPGGAAALHMRMLGPMTISRNGSALALPSSRKVRAMIAYLALAPHPVARGHLCELLWDVPDDPRGELRWCLSKIRRVLDEPGRRRVETGDDTVRLDLGDCVVDVIEIGAGHAGGRRDLAGRAPAGTVGIVRGRVPRRARDRPQPAIRRLARGAAAPPARRPGGRAGKSRQAPAARQRADLRLSRAMARARAVRSARA